MNNDVLNLTEMHFIMYQIAPFYQIFLREHAPVPSKITPSFCHSIIALCKKINKKSWAPYQNPEYAYDYGRNFSCVYAKYFLDTSSNSKDIWTEEDVVAGSEYEDIYDNRPAPE